MSPVTCLLQKWVGGGTSWFQFKWNKNKEKMQGVRFCGLQVLEWFSFMSRSIEPTGGDVKHVHLPAPWSDSCVSAAGLMTEGGGGHHAWRLSEDVGLMGPESNPSSSSPHCGRHAAGKPFCFVFFSFRGPRLCGSRCDCTVWSPRA